MALMGGSTKVKVLTQDQRNLLNATSNLVQGNLGESGPVYDGQITPDATSLQTQAFQGIGGLYDQWQQPNAQIDSMLAGQSANGMDPAQYAKESILDPATLAWQDEQERMEAMYGGSWGQTGAYQDIMQKGLARFGVGIGDEMAEFARYQQDTGNANRLTGVQGSIDQRSNLADTFGSMLDFGGEERSIQGQFNTEALNKWQAGQDYNNPWLGFLGPAVGTQAFAVGQQEGWGPAVADSFMPL